MNNDELKKKLTSDEYKVLVEGGTEAPFSGKFYHEHPEGTYTCKACGSALFPSTAKFHSDMAGLAGWPSFDDAIPGAIEYKPDDTLGMHRTEVVCANCKSHLGHLFDDSQSKTGKHLCINSVCLDIKPEQI
jgi:peptide-methionine (R)-S-oxide reductase